MSNVNSEKQEPQTNNNNVPRQLVWQEINLSGNADEAEVIKKYWKLYDRFVHTTKRDPNFSNVRSKFFAAEQEVADKQKESWLNGHGSSEEYEDQWY